MCTDLARLVRRGPTGKAGATIELVEARRALDTRMSSVSCRATLCVRDGRRGHDGAVEQRGQRDSHVNAGTRVRNATANWDSPFVHTPPTWQRPHATACAHKKTEAASQLSARWRRASSRNLHAWHGLTSWTKCALRTRDAQSCKLVAREFASKRDEVSACQYDDSDAG